MVVHMRKVPAIPRTVGRCASVLKMVLDICDPSVYFHGNPTSRAYFSMSDEFRFLGKLPTYPSPKPSFFPKREVSVNVSLGEG